MKFGNASLAFLMALMIALVGCGAGDGDANGNGEKKDDVTTAGPPTKEAVIGLLRDMVAALEAKDHDKAVTYLVEFPGMTPEKAKKGVAGFLEKREISKAGVEILAQRGTFGTLTQVFPERGAYLAKKAGVPVDECWAMSCDGAEVAVHQKDGKLRLIRLDDVGKL